MRFPNKKRADIASGIHISENRGIRHLHLHSETIQSAMRLSDPTALVLAYTRSMFGFLLLQATPKKLWMIGLGGASIPKYIHAYLPEIRCTSIELHAEIIQVARSQFALPEENPPQFCVLHADGGEYVQDKFDCVDTILIDGFDGYTVASELASEAFFANCYSALRRDGVLGINLWRKDKLFPVYCQRLQSVFGTELIALPARELGNIIVFAHKAPRPPTEQQLRERALHWQSRLGMDFTGFAKELEPVE